MNTWYFESCVSFYSLLVCVCVRCSLSVDVSHIDVYRLWFVVWVRLKHETFPQCDHSCRKIRYWRVKKTETQKEKETEMNIRRSKREWIKPKSCHTSVCFVQYDYRTKIIALHWTRKTAKSHCFAQLCLYIESYF